MPANKKYLLNTPLGRASKVLAAILGGVLVTSLLHILAGLLWNPEVVVLSMLFTFPMLWVVLITMVYWVKKPQKAWSIILVVSLLGGLAIYLIKT